MARSAMAFAPLVRSAAATVAVVAAAISLSVFQAGESLAATSALPNDGHVNIISCASPGNCAAIGDVISGNSVLPFVANEKKGTWGKEQKVPGLSALPGGVKGAAIVDVSCASAGNCSAGGFYEPRSRLSDNPPARAIVVTEKRGVWGKVQRVTGLPGGSDPSQSVGMMSCSSACNCTATGSFQILADADAGSQVFVITEKNGTWGKAEQFPGLDAIDNDNAGTSGISCWSPGNCTVIGGFDDGATDEPFADSQTNGVWGTVQTFPAIVAAAKGNASGLNILSCGSGGNCTTAGVLFTPDNVPQVFSMTESKGSWSGMKPIPGFASLPGGGATIVAPDALPCPSAGNCTLARTYVRAQGHVQTFVVAEKNGTWSKPRSLTGFPAGSNSSTIETMSCGGEGSCSIGGFYDTRTDDKPFVAMEKHGTWGKATLFPGFRR